MTEAAGTAWIRDGFIGARSAGCSELRMLEDESFKANLSFALFFQRRIRYMYSMCLHAYVPMCDCTSCNGCMYVWVYIYIYIDHQAMFTNGPRSSFESLTGLAGPSMDVVRWTERLRPRRRTLTVLMPGNPFSD